MDNKYTLEDVEKFIDDYKNSQGIKPKDWMVSIPGIGKKIYEKATLEEQKRDVFEKAYKDAVRGSSEEQVKFIKQMTPVLDSFYNKDRKTKKR